MTLSALATELLEDLQTERFEGGVGLCGLHEWLGEPIPAIKAALAELKLAGLITSSSSRYFAIRGRLHGPRDDSARRKAHAARLIAAGVTQREAARAAQLSHRTVQRLARGEA